MFFNKKKKENNKEEINEDRVIAVPEIVQLTERLSHLDKLELLGAETIREYKSIQERIETIKREDEFHLWFEDNKEQLILLFRSMKDHFINIGAEFYEIIYEDNKHLKFNKYIFNRDNLLKFLQRYGYRCEDNFCCNNRIKMRIYYDKKF